MHITRGFLALSNAILGTAIFIFASGFFPYKPFIQGYNAYSAEEDEHLPSPHFDRVIFMVVDALRSDFVYSDESGFSFVQSLIKKGHALPFTAYASSPTITMPKIKAITTGSVPSFLDVILNFAESDSSSTLAHVDTWLHQLKRMPDGKLVMYGDDTWLKLFPNFFDRSDGTTSFFVSDFEEVDRNVTRHVSREIRKSDWNGWIMHFLGLDHIGHKSGPRSPHMIPKQREMDKVVEEVYNGMISLKHLDSTLFILCGDHGMNEAGNHGGSSPGETSPALVFISPKLEKLKIDVQAYPLNTSDNYEFYRLVQQSDIAATVAALLGVPIPLNNLGVIIPTLLELWENPADRLSLLRQNVRQVHRILLQSFGQGTFDSEQNKHLDCSSPSLDIEHLQCGWMSQQSESSDSKYQYNILYKYLRVSQGILSSTASNYDVSKLGVGVSICGCLFVAQILKLVFSLSSRSECWEFALLSCITVAYSVMMFASSFVEEEHQFWYWLGGGLIVHLFLIRLNSRRTSRQSVGATLLALLLLRLIRRWNQTGQKFAGNPDIARDFLATNPVLLWTLVLLTHIYFAIRIIRYCHPLPFRCVEATITAFVALAAFLFKLSFTTADAPEIMLGLEKYLGFLATSPLLVYQARLLFALIVIILAFLTAGALRSPVKTEYLRAIESFLTFFLCIQSRVYNIPLLLIFEGLAILVMASHLQLKSLTPVEHSIYMLSTQYISFFAFGGTNSISSIDLSSAYNGIGGYNVLAVGALTFVGNWAGPLWWAVAFSAIPEKSSGGRAWFNAYAIANNIFVFGSVTATMVACMLLRSHLFIWTVFSPKYLYTMAWSFLQHMVVNMGLASCIHWYTLD